MEENKQEIIDDKELENEQDADQEVVEESNDELEQLRQEKEEINNRLLRLQADYDNFRRRTQKEKEADRKYRSQSLVEELIPALDNFERALAVQVDGDSAKNFSEGMKMVYNQFKTALEKEGVEAIPAEGEEFDPHLHQAIMQVEDENYESNVVVEELQKGYRLKDRVIRPSMVKVNQ
ncbi:nucleotide exchange factor GrpE [Halobacillus sp. ACCC02827]|uniref:nucleotide exchange factor GrpE n=1 Tax=Bacillaceae TaxID=186817 RepID=UPI0002A4D678|nr:MULTISPECIES: nucleotide exchange factor GrpE [Bacillaceae]ELK45503.1 GrpE protein HSP-70 cofactor [Halobacillus sp. BAB-2008]QHT47209.1 nucleotide exchange factor GrpE [Bacillus sp. SB49]WJE14442.1 nucleotide exchange factor GrpE [Halobacillus sp. ACCC02827]